VDRDPGLDEIGREQAQRVARELATRVPRDVAVWTSPLRRCRETAKAFTDLIGTDAVVEPRVAEIPSPEGVAMADRVDWLRAAMAGSWGDLDERYTAYRDRVVEAVIGTAAGTVVFSHFIAINAAIGSCLDDDRLVIDRLDNTSITTIEVVSGGGSPRLRLVERGRQADTLIR